MGCQIESRGVALIAKLELHFFEIVFKEVSLCFLTEDLGSSLREKCVAEESRIILEILLAVECASSSTIEQASALKDAALSLHHGLGLLLVS